MASLQHGVGHHHANDLADVLHGVDGKNRLVARKRRQHGVARDIARKDHSAHTRHGQRVCRVNAQQPAVGNLGQNRRGVQGALDLGDVVHISGRSCHLGARTLVVTRLAGGRGRCWFSKGCLGSFHDQGVGCFHAGSPSSLKDSRLMFSRPWLSSQKRCSRLPSTWVR